MNLMIFIFVTLEILLQILANLYYFSVDTILGILYKNTATGPSLEGEWSFPHLLYDYKKWDFYSNDKITLPQKITSLPEFWNPNEGPEHQWPKVI